MASYMAISSISKKIIEQLQKEMVPDLIPSGEYIGLAAPNEKDNLLLGVFLYDIRESDEIKANLPIAQSTGALKNPPIYLNLYYMITAYMEGDVQFRAMREEMILGRVIRLFHDHPVILLEKGEIPAKLELMKIGIEEKTKIWSFSGMPYRISVFYKVSPVTIDSGIVREIARVTEVDIRLVGERRYGLEK